MKQIASEALATLNLPVQAKDELIDLCLEIVRVLSEVGKDESRTGISEPSFLEFLRCFKVDYEKKEAGLT